VQRLTPVWWLVFEDDDGRAVVLIPASALIYARLEASKLKLDAGDLIEAHQLDEEMTGRVPKKMIAKRLTQNEAQKLLDRLT
jgi:hypothetical protein